jgi:hypothetical protein
MKIYPQIGSKYNGPPLDRPALRQLPHGWIVEDPDPDQTTFGGLGVWLVMLIIAIVIADIVFFWGWPW